MGRGKHATDTWVYRNALNINIIKGGAGVQRGEGAAGAPDP